MKNILLDFPKMRYEPTFRLEMQIGNSTKVETFTARDIYAAETKAYGFIQTNGFPASVLFKGNQIVTKYAAGFTYSEKVRLTNN